MSDTHITSVILDKGIDRLLDYAVPESLVGKVLEGRRVVVPVRGRLQKGTIASLEYKTPVFPLKPIIELLSENQSLPPDLMKLATWMSTYYMTPLRRIMQIMLPQSIRSGKEAKTQLFVTSLYSLNQLREYTESIRQKHPTQAQMLDLLLQAPKGLFLTQISEEIKSAQRIIKTLVNQKIVECLPVAIDRTPALDYEFFPTRHKTLSHEQTQAFEKIKQALHANQFETHLIHGVTGSGKTEIYLQAIDEALTLNKGTIFLVPEIALTSQTVERLKGRFKEKIVLLHHRLSQGQRLDTWNQIAGGKVPIVIGARSALFSPLPNLGLIIVDEEHDPSYKQTDHPPCYHARDCAIVRAKICSATILLGSATPSLESFSNAKADKYQLSTLMQRPTTAQLPHVSIVDMRKEFEKAKGFALFSDKLLQAIEKRTAKGEQTLLLLNRRGYHTTCHCLKCGHIIQCPHCDISLTFHQGTNRFLCHLCHYELVPPPRVCPKCQESEGLKFKGVGTELVERSLHALFPTIRTIRLDADTTRHKGSHEKLYKQFRSGKADLLIGTQMIAKGLHFPSVTLVGILNIDSTLHIPDFRAQETAFQLITQAAGRAGRGEIAGEVIIQTTLPEHPTILQASQQNYNAFFESEMSHRKLFDYPPYTHLIKLTFVGKNVAQTEQAATVLRQDLIAKLPPHFQFLPVVPCGHAKVKDNYRFQFLIKTPKITPFFSLFPLESPFSSIGMTIDIDPLSTFF